MDWKAVAQLVVPFAPTVGKILGGLIPFPGGAILGEWAGNALASALGVPNTPEAIGSAVQNMPPAELEARLAAVEKEAAAKWDAMARIAEAEAKDRTEQAHDINATIRAEAKASVPWWHWRHLLGYVLVLLGVEVVTLFPLIVFGRIGAADMAAIIGALTPITSVFAALNGYIAQDNTRRLTTAITGEHAPTISDKVVDTVKSVVSKAGPAKATVVISKPAGSRD